MLNTGVTDQQSKWQMRDSQYEEVDLDQSP